MKHLLIITALFCSSAHAEFKTGNELYAQMTSGNNSDWFNAIGYVTGVADSIRGTLTCPPPSVTAGQTHDLVKQFLESSPAIRHFTGDMVVTYVLKQTWPCAKKGNAL